MNRREFLVAGAAIPVASSLSIGEDQGQIIIRPPGMKQEPPEPWHPFRSREGIENARKVILRNWSPTCFSLPWDFNYASGDTIKEKYQSLLGVVEAACHILYSRFQNHSEWKRLDCHSCSLLTGPTVMSVLECSALTLEDIREGKIFSQRNTEYDNGNITRVGFLKDTMPVDCYKDREHSEDWILIRANVATDPVSESMFNGLNYVPIILKNLIA